MSVHAREYLHLNIDRMVQESDHVDLRVLADKLEQFTCKENKRDWNDSISQLNNLHTTFLQTT